MYTYPKRKKFENLKRRILKHSYLILSLLFLTPSIFAMDLIRLSMLIKYLPESSNGINRFSDKKIGKEEKFVYSPIQSEEKQPVYFCAQEISCFTTNIETLSHANWARYKFENFKGRGDFTKEQRDLAANFYKTLTAKYEAYCLVRDKKGKNHKAIISKKESDYVMTARSFARQWPNLK